MDPITLRAMRADDAATVAALHAASWRTAYRHILSAEYLAGPVDEERVRHWQARLAAPDHSRFGVIAMEGERPVGFVYVIADADPRWGHLIDNLHVLTERRGLGIGPQLLLCLMADVPAAAAIKVASALRAQGLRVEVFADDKAMGKQLAYANTLGAPFAAILGSAELAAGTVALKDLKTGEQLAVPVASVGVEVARRS